MPPVEGIGVLHECRAKLVDRRVDKMDAETANQEASIENELPFPSPERHHAGHEVLEQEQGAHHLITRKMVRYGYGSGSGGVTTKSSEISSERYRS